MSQFWRCKDERQSAWNLQSLKFLVNVKDIIYVSLAIKYVYCDQCDPKIFFLWPMCPGSMFAVPPKYVCCEHWWTLCPQNMFVVNTVSQNYFCCDRCAPEVFFLGCQCVPEIFLLSTICPQNMFAVNNVPTKYVCWDQHTTLHEHTTLHKPYNTTVHIPLLGRIAVYPSVRFKLLMIFLTYRYCAKTCCSSIDVNMLQFFKSNAMPMCPVLN